MGNQLIINADDYGMNNDINDAILELAEMHAISSTTIMANMVSEDYLNEISKYNNSVSIGLHFNILEGKPVSLPEQVFSLIDSSGNFFSLNVFLARYMLKKVRLEHIEKELLSQLTLLKERNLNVSHADSHKHIHQFPFIGKIIQDVFLRYGFRKMRNCRITDESDVKTNLYRGIWEIAKLENKRLISPDTLVSSFWGIEDNYDVVFNNSLIKAFKENTCVEFMTHPAKADEAGSRLNRKKEYLFWKSMKWKKTLEKEEIKLINYNEL